MVREKGDPGMKPGETEKFREVQNTVNSKAARVASSLDRRTLVA